MKTQFVFLLFVTTSMFVSGCGGVTLTDEDGDKVRVSKEGNSIRTETKDGRSSISSENETVVLESQNNDGSSTVAQAGEGAKIPTDFPKSIPIYTDSRVTVAINTKTDDKQSYQVSLESNDKVTDVIHFYESHFESNNWEITNRTNLDSNGQTYFVIEANKDGIKCAATAVSSKDSEVVISLIVEVAK